MSDFSARRWQLILVAVAVGWFSAFAAWPSLFPYVGVKHYGVWFLDSFALLASNDALAVGRDPYLPNTLDYFHRPHGYSHWWLRLGDLGLTRAHNVWLGLVWVVGFFVAACAFLRPVARGEVLWYLVVLCCPPVLLAVNRANNDLVVFVLLAPVVPCLLSASRPLRLLSVGLVAIATGLKYYPAVTGLVLLSAVNVTQREVRWRLVLAVCALVVVGFSVVPELARIMALVPKAEGLMTFGATALWSAFGMGDGVARAVSLLVAAVLVVVVWRSSWFDGWKIAPANQAAWLTFILGAALLAGCFLTSTNFAYRWIFAIWLAPFLWRVAHDPTAPRPVHRLAMGTAVLLVVVLWGDSMVGAALGGPYFNPTPETAARWARGFVLAEQPLAWGFFGCLLAFLVQFTRENLRALFESPRKDS
jgi:hypothetical protein